MMHPESTSELKQLSDEEIRTWPLEAKDRWWLANVYKGDMPQLTLRSALTGMMLGGVLSLTNLYVGARTGWTLGVGITSVILAFSIFKLASRLRLTKTDFSLLENNCMQSIATSAGYMTMPLVSSLAAYMMITGHVVPMWVSMGWMILLSILGVLFAFPLKRRFINDEQLPFPEGRAAGVVMHGLHGGSSADGLFKGKLIAITAGLGGLVSFAKSHSLLERLSLGFLAIPDYLDGWLYRWVWTPAVLGTPLKDITVRFESDFVMMAAGGLMGIRVGVSLLIGACLNYCVLVPWMIQRGDIAGALDPAGGVITYSFKGITAWSLWTGVAMMTTSALYAFFSKPKVVMASFRGLFRRRQIDRADPMLKIELPMKVFVFGIPAIGALVVLWGKFFFDLPVILGVIAIPLVFAFSLIAINATGLTSVTPSSALGKLTQLTYGVLAPGNMTANVVTGSITGEVASNASNLLMDIKPGYMLGAKPRQQALGHVLGIFAGAIVAVPVFYLIFLRGDPNGLVTDANPFPSAVVWKAVAEVMANGLHQLQPSAQIGAVVGALAGIGLEMIRGLSKGRFPLSAVGIGLAFVLPFTTSFVMFFGAFLFWVAARASKRETGWVHRTLVANYETTCAGLVAGGSIAGILVQVIDVLLVRS